jgi:glycosyltransferase involved in cell wall biosynthesis
VSGRTPLIAVDASPAARAVHTGTERFTAEVCRRLPAEMPEARFVFYAPWPGAAPGIDLTVLRAPRLWSQARLPAQLWRSRPDLLFVPAHAVPFLAPGAALTVVHGLEFERFPSAYGPADLAYLRVTTRWAERRCRRLLTVSEASKRDLVELHGVPPGQVTVAHPGGGAPRLHLTEPEARRRLTALGVDRPFALHVGRVEARKNQLTALAAVEQLPELQFVAAGPVRDPDLAARLRRSGRCRVLGSVAQTDLEALYAHAEVLLFPSLYEGFGFPILEAMERGLPVVTAAVSSLPEVGGSAAEYAEDPMDPEALAAALERALSRRQELAGLGRDQAALFTWERTVSSIASVMRALVE